jgi:hypothetical protein
MNNSAHENPALRERFAEVFSRLSEQDVEQFYAQYQLWLLRRRVPIIQKQIEALDEHLAENQQVIQSLQPSAIALAVLARLQSNGVGNIELLDQMLERGEDWLDRMMQRLDYCEQVEDFIQGDYTQWCYRSLEGAYDWIDTLLGAVEDGEEPRQSVEGDGVATEELLLQKLRLDDEEEMLEATLKQPTVTDEDESKDSVASGEEEVPLGVAEELPPAGSGGEGQSEEVAALEQPPELANWEDLEAPEGRPAPWYSVNLAADASTVSAQPEEMNEWIKVLQEENASGVEAAVDSVGVQGPPEVSTEQAALGGASADEEEVVESEEVPGEGASGGEDEQAQRAEEVPSEPASSPSSEETRSEQLPSEEEAAELVSSTASESVEPVSGVDEAPGKATEATDAVEQVELALDEQREAEPPESQEAMPIDVSQDEPGEAQEIGTAQESVGEEESTTIEVVVEEESATIQVVVEEEIVSDEKPGERESVSQAAGEALPEEAPDNELADAEESRPWYEYLDLEAQVTQERSAIEERVEPEEVVSPEMAESAAADREIREYAGGCETEESSAEIVLQEASEREPESTEGEQAILEDDATQPMALRDIQRAQAKLAEAAHPASDPAEQVPSAASEMVSTEVGEVEESVEIEQEEVRETLRFTEQEEAARSEAPDQGQEIRTQEERAPVSSLAQQPPSHVRSEERPKKRGFWRRLFGWLWGS